MTRGDITTHHASRGGDDEQDNTTCSERKA